MSHSLEKEWFSYFEQLNEAEKKSVISLIKTFLKRQDGKADGGIEAAAGNYMTQEEMEKKASKW